MLKINIFYDGATITQNLDMKGSAEQNIELPTGVKSDSIRLYALDNIIKPLPFIYYPINFKSNTNNKIIAQIIDKDGKFYEGQYITHSNDQVVIMQENNKQIINKYRNLTLLNNFSNDHAYIQLISAYTGKIYLNYTVNNITWSPYAELFTPQELNNDLILQLYAKIDNKNKDFNTTKLVLVAGKLDYQITTNYNVANIRSMRGISNEFEPANQDNVNNIQQMQKYEFTQNMTISESISNIQLQLIEFKAEFLYYVNLNHPQQDIHYGYKFIAPYYIPAMPVKVINYNNNLYLAEGGVVYASTTITESPSNSEVNIRIGPTDKIKIINDVEVVQQDQIVTDHNNSNGNHDIAYQVKNYNDINDINAKNINANYNDINNKNDTKNYNDINDKQYNDINANYISKRVKTNIYTIISNIYNYTNSKAKLELNYDFGDNKISDIVFKVDEQHITVLGQLPPASNNLYHNNFQTRFIILVNITNKQEPYRTILKYTEQIYS